MPLNRSPPFSPDPEARRRFGRYYTPEPLVGALHRTLADALRQEGLEPSRCALVDPACGPGAFLAAAEAGLYPLRAGVDLDERALSEARRLLPGAALATADAYGEGLEQLCRAVAGVGAVAVIGNPPYVANSELLRSGRYHAVRDRLLPFAREVARTTSIRDDYALFFGVADRVIEAAGGRGAIGFVTSASFVDNFLYAPMRRWLLSRYRLRVLVELGSGLFEGTRVKTALSVWVRDDRGQAGRPFDHARLTGSVEERLAALDRPLPLAPAHPHGEGLLLNAPDAEDARVASALRAAGDPISSLFSFSAPGLKTRFEELLVDRDREALAARMRDFFTAPDAAAFAARHGIPERALKKLRAAFAARERTRFDARAIRPFAQYAGRKHRFAVPEAARLFAYVDPALIPRGDHRFRGDFDPHRCEPKLVFNVREVPLSAAVVQGPVCVHDYRHARFAPLWVPRKALEQVRPRAPLGPDALNLSPPWAQAARLFETPADLLYYAAAIVNSRLLQERFAPAFGATEEVPVARIDERTSRQARALARAARAAGPGEDLPDEAERWVEEVYRL